MANSLVNTSKKEFFFCSKLTTKNTHLNTNSVVASLQPIACVCDCRDSPTKVSNILPKHLQPQLANFYSDLSGKKRIKELLFEF